MHRHFEFLKGRVTFICSYCFKTVDSTVEEEQDEEFIHYYATCPICRSRVEVALRKKTAERGDN